MELEMNVLNRICQTYVHFNGLHMPVTQEFKKKNRYLEVLPYSHTLVGVPNSEGESFYNNANFIRDPIKGSGDKAYIAA